MRWRSISIHWLVMEAMERSNRRTIIPRTFISAFKKKPPQLQKQITKAVKQLGIDPKYPSLRCHRVRGKEGVWEAYVDRARYRITFEYDEDGNIVLLNNCTHDILP